MSKCCNNISEYLCKKCYFSLCKRCFRDHLHQDYLTELKNADSFYLFNLEKNREKTVELVNLYHLIRVSSEEIDFNQLMSDVDTLSQLSKAFLSSDFNSSSFKTVLFDASQFLKQGMRTVSKEEIGSNLESQAKLVSFSDQFTKSFGETRRLFGRIANQLKKLDISIISNENEAKMKEELVENLNQMSERLKKRESENFELTNELETLRNLIVEDNFAVEFLKVNNLPVIQGKMKDFTKIDEIFDFDVEKYSAEVLEEVKKTVLACPPVNYEFPLFKGEVIKFEENLRKSVLESVDRMKASELSAVVIDKANKHFSSFKGFSDGKVLKLSKILLTEANIEIFISIVKNGKFSDVYLQSTNLTDKLFKRILEYLCSEGKKPKNLYFTDNNLTSKLLIFWAKQVEKDQFIPQQGIKLLNLENNKVEKNDKTKKALKTVKSKVKCILYI